MKRIFLICCVIIFLINRSVWAQSGDNQKICVSCQGGEGGGGGTGSDPCSILTTNDTLYVDASKPNNNGNGTSWGTAKKNLQAALYIANFCSNPNKKVVFIKVAKGTYTASTTVNTSARDYTFFVGNKVSIMGGYPTEGGSEAQRDFVNNPTILNGEIQDLYEAYHVLMIYDVSGAIIIDGFQIKNGFADGTGSMEIETNVSAPRNVGGGAFIRDAANVKFANCVFYSNVASSSSGAIYSRNSNVKLENCVFVNNTSGTYGGAIQLVNSSNVSITNCTFYNNLNLGGGEAIYNNTGSTLEVTNTIIWGNVRAVNGGGTTTYSNSLFPNAGAFNYNLKEDPKFLRLADLDGPDNKWFTQDDGLNLEFCSPALNRGNNDVANLPNKDITNNDRIYNSQIDIGAYERRVIPYMFNASNLSLHNDSCDSYVFGGVTGLNAANECRLIALLEPSVPSGLRGRIKAKTIIETTDLTFESMPLVSRHYDINNEFATNNGVYVTLYFNNLEFINYNSRPGVIEKLPVNSADPNKVNLRVVKFSGVSATGAPESYGSLPKVISDPVSVTWNATSSKWQIKFFDEGSLGGYFITSSKEYVFTGNGNWSNAANWLNNAKPPASLPRNYSITILEGAQCILDITQKLFSGSNLTVKPGASFSVQGILEMEDDLIVSKSEIVFSNSGQFIVPPGITNIKVGMFGAGGYGFDEWGISGSSRGMGGHGGFMAGDLAVTPGEVLVITVATSTEINENAEYSMITRTDGTILLLAAGGGGGSKNLGLGGDAGSSGQDGTLANDVNPNLRVAKGATVTAGGIGGEGYLIGTDGTVGVYLTAGIYQGTQTNENAHGGKGYYGGGGAGTNYLGDYACGGGGGGSNYASANDFVITQNSNAGSIVPPHPILGGGSTVGTGVGGGLLRAAGEAGKVYLWW